MSFLCAEKLRRGHSHYILGKIMETWEEALEVQSRLALRSECRTLALRPTNRTQ